MAAAAPHRQRLVLFALFLLTLACSSKRGNDGSAAGPSAASAGTTAVVGPSSATSTSSGGSATSGAQSTGDLGSGGNEAVATTSSGTSTTTAVGAGGSAGTAANGAAGTGTTTGMGGSGTAGTGTGGNGGSGDAVNPTTDPVEPDPNDLGPVTLYYLNVTEALVMSVSAEGGQPQVVVQDAGQGPDGVAVDASAGHIYWTNMGVPANDDGFILRSDLDGGNVTTIVEAGDTYTPKQVKLEPTAEKLYWGDREGMRIQRCNLDGSELETLVTIAEGDQARADRANHAVGIAVDVAGGYIYWIQKGPPNGGQGSIRRAGLEMPAGETSSTRTDIEVLYAGLPEPIDLDLDVDAGMMYWTDRGDSTIDRAPIEIPQGSTAESRDDREILVAGVDTAIGIWLDVPLGHVYYTGTDVVGRVDLDGANNTTLVSNAGVLTGITGVRLP